MAYSLIERQIESTLYDMFGDKAVRLMGVVNKMAAKQGGGSTIENYQLLGKRALIVAGVAVGVVYVTVGFRCGAQKRRAARGAGGPPRARRRARRSRGGEVA